MAPRRLLQCGYRALRRMTFRRRPGGGDRRVVFAGDSITQQWPSLSADFAQFETINRGINGETSAGLLRRWNDDILSCQPCAVVLLIGTNDLSSGTRPRRVLAAIRRMLAETARPSDPIPIIVCKVLPRALEKDRFPKNILELNRLIDALHRDPKNVQVCDTFSALADSTGSIRGEFSLDGLHLNTAGYAVLGGALRPLLSRIVSRRVGRV